MEKHLKVASRLAPSWIQASLRRSDSEKASSMPNAKPLILNENPARRGVCLGFVAQSWRSACAKSRMPTIQCPLKSIARYGNRLALPGKDRVHPAESKFGQFLEGIDY
jgi:hypothetical protein